MAAIFQQATVELISQAQTTYNEGGKLPIDQGFLRNSFSVSLSGLPSGPTKAQAGVKYDWKSEETTLLIAGAPLGATIFGGWTAAYAMRMEYGFFGQDSKGRTYSQEGFAFLRTAVANWQVIVDDVSKEAQRRFPDG